LHYKCEFAFAVHCIVVVPVCGFVCVFVCLWVCCRDGSRLRASVFARLGLWVKVVAISNVVHTALILRDFLSVIKIFWPNISNICTEHYLYLLVFALCTNFYMATVSARTCLVCPAHIDMFTAVVFIDYI